MLDLMTQQPDQPRDVLLTGYLTYSAARRIEGESIADSEAAAGEAIRAYLPDMSVGAAGALVRDIIDWCRTPLAREFLESISEDEREVAERRYFAWGNGMDFGGMTTDIT
jgi:hypothetical protein